MRARSLTLSASTATLVAVSIFAGCGASKNGPGAAGTDGNMPSGSDTNSASMTPPVGAGDVYMGGATDPSTGLPVLPVLGHVTANVHATSAEITFDPFPGAVDYRVYVQPEASAIRLNADGSLAGVSNATYRCAGYRAATGVWVDFAPGPAFEDNPDGVPNWISVDTQVQTESTSNASASSQAIHGYTRSLAEATLGYIFQDPTPDTIPIYAVGDPAILADNYGYGIRETQTRAKLYVADNSKEIAAGWRDDGIAFYAPSSAKSKACGTGAPVPVYERDYTTSTSLSHIYYASAAEAKSRGTANVAFYVCPGQAASMQPLMRAYYILASAGGNFGKYGDTGHDELVVGQERFLRARCQGSTFGPCATASQALWSVHWSGITAPTKLIVEALDAGCPFPGLLGANSVAATLVSPDDANNNTTLKNDPFFSFADLQKAAANGEVFLNGQFDGKPTPHPIARATVQVAPQTPPTMQFASDFGDKPETFSELFQADGKTPNCGLTPAIVKLASAPDPECDGSHQLLSPNYQVLLEDVQDARYSVGITQGELWTDYSGGKFRITPKVTPATTATVSDTSFLHAVMEVTSFTTGRRYPQIIISEQDMLTSQYLLDRSPGDANSNIGAVTILNPIDAGEGRHVLELELCHGRRWQVNNHCPWFLLEEQNRTKTGVIGTWSPHPDLFDKFQDDRSVRYDLFLSTHKAFVYVDSRPYGCVNFAGRATKDVKGVAITPSPAPPKAGNVTVSFGDVEYHAGAESGYFQIYSNFHLEHMLYETVRHMDYVAYNSGEAAPVWDETSQPCVTDMYQGGGAGTQTPEQ